MNDKVGKLRVMRFKLESPVFPFGDHVFIYPPPPLPTHI